MKRLKILIPAFLILFFGIGSAYALNVPKDHLVSPRWVYSHMHNKNLVIVDVRPPAGYASGHIPGAVDIPFYSIQQDYPGIPILGDIASPERMTNIYRYAGITKRSVIVFYEGNMSAMPFGYSKETRELWEAWFYGLTKVAIVNGGLSKWIAEKLPVTTKPFHPIRSNFKITKIRLNSRATYQRIWSFLYTHKAVVIDSRPPEYYNGVDSDARFSRHGHIPGAINVPRSTLEKKTKAGYYEFVTPAEAVAILKKAKVNLSKPIITQCNTGFWASEDWFVIKFLVGKKNVADFNDSWVVYSRISNAPVANIFNSK